MSRELLPPQDYDNVDESAWRKKSVVDIKPVGNGEAVLKYLAPYVHRVAISDKRIVKIDDTHVTYTVTPSGTKQAVVRRVPGETFVGSFVQHVLTILMKTFRRERHMPWEALAPIHLKRRMFDSLAKACKNTNRQYYMRMEAASALEKLKGLPGI